ncbi:hypothetical protein Tdes44962_MAKER07407 [Teratosphaeria destructans]|uniref:Uncharacterized protein n=1 Tax=Teratosphaeria destructans TaxID=418781 RepID=A0A9W7SZ40_9PEZI|nr:hypothetical protein Tdes44962_MAKER07407 [Teratosphaeria destructans]
MASLRLLTPRASFPLHSKQLQQRLVSIRQASTTPPKPRVLAKPERFNPPSHPSRIRSRQPKYYGPTLSEEQKRAQRTKRYPHMMPPEGTLMHSFLTNRSIHLYFSLSVLVSLAFFIWLQDFLHNTPYRDLLPPNNMIFAHPFTFFSRWWEVYTMHVQYISAQTAEKRKQKLDDAEKRKEYRKAHGIETKGEGMLEKFVGGNAENAAPRERGAGEEASPLAAVEEAALPEGAYVDFEGKVQTERKKWFGIW